MNYILNYITSNGTIVFAIFVCFLFGYYKYVYSYWEKNKVPFVPGIFPFGSITSVIFRKQGFISKLEEVYKEFKQQGCKYVGLYFFTRKALMIIDPTLVKKILSTDFQYFHDRGIYHDEKNDPLSAHLVALSGDKWKELRQKLSPIFSPGKLKSMFVIVLKCAEELTDTLKRKNENEAIEIKDLAARYTIDVIGSCAFGIKCNSLANPNSEFRTIGKRIFQSNFSIRFNRIIIRNAPWIAKKLGIKVIDREVSKFFIGIVQETIEYRRKNKVSRPDFLQQLMELMDKEDEDNGTTKGGGKFGTISQTLTTMQAAAHSFVFFLAGYETSASTITFALYELSRLTQIQERVREEVYRVLKKYNNDITYDAIMEMNYMEQVLLETMRKYPTFVLLMRKCTRDYKLEETRILEKGIPVIIPVHTLHHDADFFSEPEEFIPERFDTDQSKTRDDHTYLPFGNGPRVCIGLRFAMLQMKVAITNLLLHFKFTLNDKTSVPLVMNTSSFVLTPLGGTWLNVTPICKEEKERFVNIVL